jgi:hypothetical protein
MKSSFPTSKSTPSNSRTISGSATSGVVPGCDFVKFFTVLVIAVGGRKDTEVAGRAWVRRVETGPIREVEAIRPVAVAGRVGRFICGDFLVEPAMGVGAVRTACPRFEGSWTARRFEFATVAARAWEVPFVTCSAVGLAFEASPAPRSWAKGVESSVNVKVR